MVKTAVQECQLKMEIIEMLLFHIAFSLALLAMVAGVAFYMWSTHVKSAHKKLIRIFALVVVAFVALNFLCTLTAGVRMWSSFSRPIMSYDKAAPGGCPGGPRCMAK